MSQLDGLVATHASWLDCAVSDAQERTITSASAGDGAGPDARAWGIAQLAGGMVETRLQRNPGPFSRAAREKVRATAARTTLTWCQSHGETPSLQPMSEGAATAIVEASGANGASVCENIRGALHPRRRTALQAEGLAEHVFQLLLERRDQVPARAPADTLRAVMTNLRRWHRRAGTRTAPSRLQLRVVWSSGTAQGLAACAIGAPLWAVERTDPRLCEHCGQSHTVRISENEAYRALCLSSTPRTDEDWKRLPDGVAFSISPDAELNPVPT